MSAGDWLVELNLDGVFVDVSDDVRSLSVARAANRTEGVSRRYEAGRVTVELNNGDRAYDPVASPDVRPGIGIKVSCADSVGVVRVFTGRIDEVDVGYESYGAWSVTTLSGTDAVTLLARSNVAATAPVGEGDTVAERIDRILDAVNWPTGSRDITAGGVTLNATEFDGDSSWDLVTVAAANDASDAWINQENYVAFRPLEDAISGPTKATFADTSGTGLPYADIKLVFDDDLLANEIQYSRAGAAVVSVIDDTTSQTLFSDGIPAVLRNTELLIDSDDLADDWAKLQLLALSKPEFRVDQLTLIPRTDPDLIDAVLSLDITDRVEIFFQPPGGGDVIRRKAWVRGIRHQVSEGGTNWTCELLFASASRFNFMRYSDNETLLDEAGLAPVPSTFTGGRFEAVDLDVVAFGDLNVLQTQMVLRFPTLQAAQIALDPFEVGMLVWTPTGGLRYWSGTNWLRPGG